MARGEDGQGSQRPVVVGSRLVHAVSRWSASSTPPAPPSRPTRRTPMSGTTLTSTPRKTIVRLLQVLLVTAGFLLGAIGIGWLLKPVNAAPPGPPPVSLIQSEVQSEPVPTPPAPAWPDHELTLDRQSFEVEHEDPEIGASFSAHIDVAPAVGFANDEQLPDGTKADTVSVNL